MSLKIQFCVILQFALGSPKWCVPVTFVTLIFYESFNFLNELPIFGHFYTPTEHVKSFNPFSCAHEKRLEPVTVFS